MLPCVLRRSALARLREHCDEGAQLRQRKYLPIGVSVCAFSALIASVRANEVQTYAYDDLGRLIRVSYTGTVNNNQIHSTCFDENDNRMRYRSDPLGAAATCPTPTPAPTPSPTQTPPPPPPPSNNPPATNADSVTGKICETASKNVTANDTDPDGDLPLTVTAVATSSLADVYIVSSSTIGVAAYGSTGSTSVSYTIVDSRGASATGTLTITIQNGTGCQ